tara:strand:- start:535 stop:1326 length:792 start_codon:yes stop_codon:yes gene_type:complete
MNLPCIVFDLDETLGFFAQISRIWMTLYSLNNNTLTNQDFFNLCDLFPKIIRPGIFKLLTYLNKIKGKNIGKVVLYTNNMGPPSWAVMIIDYIQYKIKAKVFDVIIPGHVGKGSCRTTKLKTYDDLLHCAKLSTKTKICFIDDQPHAKLNEHKMVTSVMVNAYNYFYTNNEIFHQLKKYKPYKEIYLVNIKKNLEEYLLEYNSKPNENTDIYKDINTFLHIKKALTSSKKKKKKQKKQKRKKNTKKKRRKYRYNKKKTIKKKR